MHLVPNSALSESNDCHDPQTGEFCAGLSKHGVAAKHHPVFTAILRAAAKQLRSHGSALVDLADLYIGNAASPIPSATVRAALRAHPTVGALTFTYEPGNYLRAGDRWRQRGEGGVPAARNTPAVMVVRARGKK